MRGILGALILLFGVIVLRFDAIIHRPSNVRLVAGNSTANPSEWIPAKPVPEKRSVPRSYLENPLAFLSLAPIDSLQLLPGIGPVIAERVAVTRSGQRSFTKWEDLLAVKGIGPKTLERLKQAACTD
ncbi:MAG: helix-hairpin-helix domain-containing protein [bacterium]|nr:helix-hairpin-helix domain-containing protein [bacterium]